jgi:hypothetical protein
MQGYALAIRCGATPSNRHGFVSTVEIHAPKVTSQADIQTALRDAGFPVCNDPAAGKKAAVTRGRGLMLSRIALSLRIPEADNTVTPQYLRYLEPAKFESVRAGEHQFFDERKKRCEGETQEERETLVFAGLSIPFLGPSVMVPRKASEVLVNAAFEVLKLSSVFITCVYLSPHLSCIICLHTACYQDY